MIESIEKALGCDFNSLQNLDGLKKLKIPTPEYIDRDSYVEIQSHGFSFVLEEGEKVSSIHLYSEGKDDYCEFKSNIPGGVKFNDSRTEVISKLGEPISSGERCVVPIFGEKPAWDNFCVRDNIVHIEYNDSLNSIELITLSFAK